MSVSSIFQRARQLNKARPLQGRKKFQGLDISIENDKGSKRNGIDPNGKPWETKFKYPYGYIRFTEGTDDEHVDCYIGPNEQAETAYVIRQNDPWTGEYDEDKVMLGFNSPQDAKNAYLMHYDRPDFFGSMDALPMDRFIESALATKDDPGPVAKAVIHHLLKAARKPGLVRKRVPVTRKGHTFTTTVLVRPGEDPAKAVHQAQKDEKKNQIGQTAAPKSYELLRGFVEHFINTSGPDSEKNLLIITGAPGFGKSHQIEESARKLLGAEINRAQAGAKFISGQTVEKLERDNVRYHRWESWQKMDHEEKQIEREVWESLTPLERKNHPEKETWDEGEKGPPEPESNMREFFAKWATPDKDTDARVKSKKIFYGSDVENADDLFQDLWRMNGGTMVYDDAADKIIKDERLINVVARASQTSAHQREGSLPTESIREGGESKSLAGAYGFKTRTGYIPGRFAFAGKIILITNEPPSKIPPKLKSRAIMVSLNPTAAEVLEKIPEIMAKKEASYNAPEDKTAWKDVGRFLNEFLKIGEGKTSGLKGYDHRVLSDLFEIRRAFPDYEQFSALAKKKIKEHRESSKALAKANGWEYEDMSRETLLRKALELRHLRKTSNG